MSSAVGELLEHMCEADRDAECGGKRLSKVMVYVGDWFLLDPTESSGA